MHDKKRNKLLNESVKGKSLLTNHYTVLVLECLQSKKSGEFALGIDTLITFDPSIFRKSTEPYTVVGTH